MPLNKAGARAKLTDSARERRPPAPALIKAKSARGMRNLRKPMSGKRRGALPAVLVARFSILAEIALSRFCVTVPETVGRGKGGKS